ncbi:MAG: long-chain fatty acid--CoA ligase, partial [Betaproteobacteria bacterium]|nr:long-chain fatty acid--CoA ligase [Betaproteobacteria bacterium]
NRGGYKVFSIEVENCLMAHPQVQEAATVGVPCPVLGERVHAFVGLKPGYAATEVLQAELKAHCKAVLSDYKVPESYTVQTTALPRNANGKLLKREMRDQVAHLSPVLDKRA